MTHSLHIGRRTLGLTALALAAGQVLAQAEAPAAPAAAASEPQASSRSELPTVIVTAQKVMQPASKTAVALSVIGGEDLRLAGAVDARALQELSPSVQVTQESGRLQINIRGVMSINNTERGDPSNAFNVDGLYIGRPESQFSSFLDVERIEVLRGPQGTLYGRNATGGAVNVISKKPGNRLGGTVSVELGNYNARRAEATIDVPVNELLKLRAAVGSNKRDTYLKGGAGVGLEDQDDMAARLHAMLTFSPDTSLLLTAEHSKVNANGFTPVTMKGSYTGTPKGGNANWYNDLLNPVYIGNDDDAQRTVDPYYARPTFRLNENNGLRAEFRHNFGPAELVYQVGHLKSTLSNSFISPFNGAPFLGETLAGESEQLSHELRLHSTGTGPLTWVAGAYLFEEDITRSIRYNTFINPNFTFRLKFEPTVENKAKALFGQSRYALTDTLKLVTGVRFSKDTKSARDEFNGGGLTIPASPFNRTVDFSQTTWKLGLDWDLTRDTFVYGSVSTGYKAGGFNTSSDTLTYKPEELTAVELGIKTQAFKNRLQLSASVFAYDYADLQLTSTVCTTNAQNVNTCGSRTVNAASAKMTGLELEGRLRPWNDGTFDFGLSYNKSRFGSYQPVNKPPAAPTVVIDWTGQPLDRAPKGSLRLGYTHAFDLSNGSYFEVGATARYNSGYLMSSYGDDYATRYHQPAFTKYDAQLVWRSADDRYSVQVFGKNLTEEINVENRQPGTVNIGEPRTYGVRISTKF
ncbi:TonB-dependent receptor [Roseateles sp. LKC17W]|uniref:TonB-dependent receptor n=1 Tax=Pelomonas margarita TaxID=3299031 RepID=A0ABW7FDD6_9BURK